jgi:hypothetical protein
MSETQTFDPLAAFQSERGRLFGIAYRMLGSVSEAEDVLQDAWLRWHAVDPATVESPSERRARRRLDAEGRPAPADPHEHGRLLTSFLRATRDGDLEGMVSLLAHDAILYSDGGGKAHAAGIPVAGAEKIAKFLTGLGRKARGIWEVRTALVNGRPGALTYFEGRLVNVVSLRVEDGKIQNLYIMVNPDKLPRL